MNALLITGTRVRFAEEYDLFPDDTIAQGETGTVIGVDSDCGVGLRVKLDTAHPDLEEWDNEAHFRSDIAEYNGMALAEYAALTLEIIT